MVAPLKFAHMVLRTGQLERMRDWYCALLDAHVVSESPGICFITYDDEHHRIAFLAPPVPLAPKTPLSTGMHHVAYTFGSLDDLLEQYSELKAKGIAPHTPVQHGGSTSLYYRDPDGNFVELLVENGLTEEDAAPGTEGADWVRYPIGVGFDPDKMLEARRAGADTRELVSMRWAMTTSPDLPDPQLALSG